MSDSQVFADPKADALAIDTFVDALWLEEGLAKNTLLAYRRDLVHLERWLAGQSRTTADVTELDLQACLLYTSPSPRD